VFTMNVGQIILSRSWLFDKDVIIYDRSNMCQFECKDKKIELLPLRSNVRQPEQTPTAPKNTKGINLISVKVFKQKLKKGDCLFPSLALLLTLPSQPSIATTPSFSPTGLACSSCQPLLPLLPTPSHYRLHLHLYHTYTNCTKRSVMELNRATLTKNCGCYQEEI